MQQNIQSIQSSGVTKTRPSTASRKSTLNESNNRSNNGDEQPRGDGHEDSNGGDSGGQDNMLGDSESQTLSSQLPLGVLELASQAPGPRLHGANKRPRHPSRPSLEKINNESPISKEKVRSLLHPRGSKDEPVKSPSSIATPKKVAAEPTSHRAPGVSRSPLREILVINRTEDASSDEEGSVVSQSREFAGQTRGIDSNLSAHHKTQSPSKKRARDEGTDDSPEMDNQNRGDTEPKGNPSPKKRQRTGSVSQPSAQIPGSTNPPPQMADESPIRTRQSANSDKLPPRPQSVEVDPWEGFDGITDRDVTIPKDQQELLEASVLVWLPCKAGNPTPQGHVPRSLLDVWNDTVQRHSRNTNLQQVIIPEPSGSPAKERSISPDKERSISPAKERSISPTQESDAGSVSSTPYSGWGSSPVKPQHDKSMLPPSSPVAPSGFVGMRPKPKAPLGSQNPDAVSSIRAKSPRVVSQPSPRNNKKIRDIPTTSESATNKGDPSANIQHPGQGSQSHGAERHDQLFSQVHATSAPAQDAGQRSPMPSSNPLPTLGGNESDEDEMDTSVPFALGENIPDPTQSSQVEEGLGSSGASLPRVNNECVQVAVTPRIGASRPHVENSHGSSQPHESPQPVASNPRHQSSQNQQDSSQSRILNTFPFHGSNETEDFTGSSTPGGPSQEGQIQVDVPLTQQHTNSVASQSQSQGVSNQSQPDIVLDSSGPTQRHQDFSALATQQSSIEVPSSHESTLSQLHMPTQESAPEERLPGASANYPMVISPHRAEDSLARQSPSGSMGSGTQSQRAEPTENHTLNTQSTPLLARRQDFLKKAETTYAKAQNVYRQFYSTYSSFSGDFEHFTNMCNKLRAVRQKGELQRSFLWDDFVIMYLQEYAPYLDKQFTQGSETLSYEEYFLEKFKRPSHKKRSLTAQGIEEAASQAVADQEASQIAAKIDVSPPPAVPGDPTQGFVLNNYFAGSLVEQLANFDSSSINRPPPVDPLAPRTPQSPRIKFEGGELDLSVYMTTDTPAVTTYNQNSTPLQAQPQASTRTSPQTHPQAQPQAALQASPQLQSQIQPQTSPQILSQTSPQYLSQPVPWTLPHPPPQASPQAPAASPQALSQAPSHAFSQALSEASPQALPWTLPPTQASLQPRVLPHASQQQLSSQRVPQELPQTHPSASPTGDVDMDEVPETDPEDAYQDEDTLHETASVELGDESSMSPTRTQQQPHTEDVRMSVEASPAASTASDTDSSSGYDDSESENENWFLSLRHIRPKEPVWSDGPTEFKRWSEAHQNLYQYRRRRGGHKILLDENGVIRRPVNR